MENRVPQSGQAQNHFTPIILIDEHERWLESEQGSGKRLEIIDRVVPGFDFRNRCLDRSILKNIRFERIHGVRVSFTESILQDCVFSRCDLRNADFTDAQGLLPTTFPGSNLTGARLPPELNFDNVIKSIEGAGQNARAVFLVIIAACLYCLLTVGTTTDRDLLVNTASTPLPIINTPVPIAAFYWIAPVLLLFSFIWMHAYLQRIWGSMCALPVAFPDGVTLANRLYQWIPLSIGVFCNLNSPHNDGRRLQVLEVLLSIVALWFFVPATILAMWARYLPRHDFFGSVLQVCVLALALGSCGFFASRAQLTLSRNWARRTGIWIDSAVAMGTLLIAIGLFGTFTVGLIRAYEPSSGVLTSSGKLAVQVAETLGLPSRLNLSGAEVAEKPSIWSGRLSGTALAEALVSIGPVDLTARNLDRARAESAFFARVRLDGSALRELRASRAAFPQASLRGADLTDAALPYADLRDADLSGSLLIGTDLTGANLRGACLNGAILQEARLVQADLKGADLSSSHDLRIDQLRDAVCDADTRLPRGLDASVCFRAETDRQSASGRAIDMPSAMEDTDFVPDSCS